MPGAHEHCDNSWSLKYLLSNSPISLGANPKTSQRFKSEALLTDLTASPAMYSEDFESSSKNARATIEVGENRGLYLAIKDSGSCVRIQSISVAYYMCDARHTMLVQVPEMRPGLNGRQGASCVQHASASPLQEVTFSASLCYGKGTWDNLALEKSIGTICQCDPGFFPDQSDQKAFCQGYYFRIVFLKELSFVYSTKGSIFHYCNQIFFFEEMRGAERVMYSENE